MGAGLALLASPAAAAAASLKITVTPARVRPNQKYVIKVQGSFKPTEVQGRAYLWEFLQYSSKACRRTGQAENGLAKSVRDVDYAGPESASPFSRVDHWRAGTITGIRHVCAYLYPKPVSARSGVRPIARADVQFRDV